MRRAARHQLFAMNLAHGQSPKAFTPKWIGALTVEEATVEATTRFRCNIDDALGNLWLIIFAQNIEAEDFSVDTPAHTAFDAVCKARDAMFGARI